MKKLVVFTGAGISAESGIKTFRDSGGLWEGYDVEEVASPQGWAKNKELVLDFYNQRRKNVLDAKPNEGHLGLVELEKYFDVHIITQNIDDLHERAGSKNIMHLHGEILKVRSSTDDRLIYDWKKDLNKGDKCERGSQLRPHIVWFGEMVPMMETAIRITSSADIFVVIGTSMVVYPAASLIHYIKPGTPKYIVDPGNPETRIDASTKFIQEKASTGVNKLVEFLIADL